MVNIYDHIKLYINKFIISFEGRRKNSFLIKILQ